MSISGIGEKYYQNNVTTMKSTKNVNSTEEFALEKNKRDLRKRSQTKVRFPQKI